MTNDLPAWVKDAGKFPIAFSQVREDPLLDVWCVEQLGDEANVLFIASGGCTAAIVATLPQVSSLHLVDPNPSQLALVKLKIHLLRSCAPEERLELLGHRTVPLEHRLESLQEHFNSLEISSDALGPIQTVAKIGPDFVGRYEMVFSELQKALIPCASELNHALMLDDTSQQTKAIASETTLGKAIDVAIENVMALPNLVHLFGEKATNNRVKPFSQHFADRIRHAMATLPANSNPYLWQMLRGCYPKQCEIDWLLRPSPIKIPTIEYINCFMSELLQGAPSSFDMIHLSNILDWLTEEEAEEILELTFKALRPGGWTIIRQLNSSINIPSIGTMFRWQDSQASRLHHSDRSFFYRNLHIGRK